METLKEYKNLFKLSCMLNVVMLVLLWLLKFKVILL